MYITHILPNGKEVKLKEILYKDLRTFNLYGEATIKGRLNFLESFIITKGLNIMEKLYALLYLRLVCIGDNLIIGSEKGDVGVSLSFVKDNVGGINNITKVIEDKGIEYTLDYPLNFNQGDDDFLLSVVTKIKFNDKELDIGKLSEEEYEAVLLKLPKGLYGHVDKFLEHPRLFIFENGGETKIYISSADFMGRNLDNRVEISCPIYDEEIKNELIDTFEISWKDNVKARVISGKALNRYRKNNEEPFRSQFKLYEYYQHKLDK